MPASLLVPDNLAKVLDTLENIGPVILEHRNYQGSRAPERIVFDDAEALLAYLKHKTKAGDAIWVWSFGDLCKDDNAIAVGKIPDSNGEVPAGGAY
jgi:hypothetical protein